MSFQSRPIFESSFAALGLVQARREAGLRSEARLSGLILPPRGRGTLAMTIQYAPEPAATENGIDLGCDETTGPRSLGFQFEFFGVRYSWFDLSSSGFMMFGVESSAFWPGSRPGRRFIPMNRDLNNFLSLGWSQTCATNRVRIAYELRGSAGRRRMVLSLTGVPATGGPVSVVTGQLVLRERTGMIEVHTARYAPEACRIDQHAVRLTTTTC